MQIFSYPGCQKCLVKPCCKNVCEEYRENLYETRGCEVLIDTISLRECEEAVGSKVGRKGGPIELRVGDNKIRISIDIRGIA